MRQDATCRRCNAPAHWAGIGPVPPFAIRATGPRWTCAVCGILTSSQTVEDPLGSIPAPTLEDLMETLEELRRGKPRKLRPRDFERRPRPRDLEPI